MFETLPVLHMFCGKMASGKSTLASKFSQAPNSVLISEDEWLGALFVDQMSTGADYLHLSVVRVFGTDEGAPKPDRYEAIAKVGTLLPSRASTMTIRSARHGAS